MYFLLVHLSCVTGSSPPLQVLRTANLDRLYFAGLHGFKAHETEDGGRLHSDNSSGMFIVQKVQGSIRFSPLSSVFSMTVSLTRTHRSCKFLGLLDLHP